MTQKIKSLENHIGKLQIKILQNDNILKATRLQEHVKILKAKILELKINNVLG